MQPKHLFNSWCFSHQFPDLLPEVLLFIDHYHDVFVHGWSQNNIQFLRFGSHVTDHLVMREHAVTMQQAVVLNTLTAQRHLEKKKGNNYLSNINIILQYHMEVCESGRNLSYPVHGAEVHSLCKVEALIKTTVIGSRECDDKLSCTLIGPVNLRNKVEDYLKKKRKKKSISVKCNYEHFID